MNGKIGNVVTSYGDSADKPFNPTGSFWTPTLSDGALIALADVSKVNLGNYDGIGFKASLSSSIYTDGSGLQPKSLTVLACIRC